LTLSYAFPPHALSSSTVIHHPCRWRSQAIDQSPPYTSPPALTRVFNQLI
ncbi:hypothetical protein QQF64_007585, partial [Cirrhinus molitorella]